MVKDDELKILRKIEKIADQPKIIIKSLISLARLIIALRN